LFKSGFRQKLTKICRRHKRPINPVSLTLAGLKNNPAHDMLNFLFSIATTLLTASLHINHIIKTITDIDLGIRDYSHVNRDVITLSVGVTPECRSPMEFKEFTACEHEWPVANKTVCDKPFPHSHLSDTCTNRNSRKNILCYTPTFQLNAKQRFSARNFH